MISYITKLDDLRAVAVLFVFMHHTAGLLKFSVTLAVASRAYRLMERPLLNLRTQFQKSRQGERKLLEIFPRKDIFMDLS